MEWQVLSIPVGTNHCAIFQIHQRTLFYVVLWVLLSHYWVIIVCSGKIKAENVEIIFSRELRDDDMLK